MDAVFPRTRRNRRRYREKKFIRYESISIRYAFVFLPFYLFNVISISFSFFFFSFLFLFNVTYEVSILAALNYSERKYQAWSQVPYYLFLTEKKIIIIKIDCAWTKNELEIDQYSLMIILRRRLIPWRRVLESDPRFTFELSSPLSASVNFQFEDELFQLNSLKPVSFNFYQILTPAKYSCDRLSPRHTRQLPRISHYVFIILWSFISIYIPILLESEQRKTRKR